MSVKASLPVKYFLLMDYSMHLKKSRQSYTYFMSVFYINLQLSSSHQHNVHYSFSNLTCLFLTWEMCHHPISPKKSQ